MKSNTKGKILPWRTHTQAEVDLKGLRALGTEQKFKNLILISRDPNERLLDGIQILPVKLFLKRLWDGVHAG